METKATSTTFRYREGQRVQLRNSYPELGIEAGDSGVVWALYAIDPPTYEVTVQPTHGDEFDMTLTENEIRLPRTSASRTSKLPAKVVAP